MKGFLIGVFSILFMSPYNIQGDSMQPTFNSDDYIMFEGLTYSIEAPVRGDIVIFNGMDEPKKVFVKRIIGMPGEMVSVRENKVFINDVLLDEEEYVYYDEPLELTFRSVDGTVYEVPEGKYFVLGDNRQNSYDSRTWNDPFVPQENLVGKYYFDIF